MTKDQKEINRVCFPFPDTMLQGEKGSQSSLSRGIGTLYQKRPDKHEKWDKYNHVKERDLVDQFAHNEKYLDEID